VYCLVREPFAIFVFSLTFSWNLRHIAHDTVRVRNAYVCMPLHAPYGTAKPCRRMRIRSVYAFSRQINCEQVAQLSQRNRAAGCVRFGQIWKTGTVLGNIFYGHYWSIYNPCDIIGMQSYRIWWKTTQNRAKGCSVIEVVTNWKPVCDFLLVIFNSNWDPTSLYRFGVIAAYCSNFGHCVFEPPLGA